MVELVETPDGWSVPRPYWHFFRLIMDHDPPRPNAAWVQLREDACRWKPVAFWIVSGGVIATAVAAGSWTLGLAGVWVLALYFQMYRTAVKRLRNCPSVVAVFDTLRPHPEYRYASTATAVTADGQEFQVAISTWLVQEIIDRGGRVEALFLKDTGPGFRFVYGFRALPATVPNR
jgi:hypothetical protein